MKRLRRALLCLLTLGSAAVSSQALVLTWSGLGSSSDITLGTNWVGGVAPSPGDSLVFGDSSRTNPLFPNTFTVTDVTLSALNTGIFLDGSGSSPTLTLSGNVKSNAGSSYFLVFSQVGVNLTAGSHTFDVQGGDVYLFSRLLGSGNIVKTGARSLVISSGDNVNTPFTGNITLTAGDISVGGDNALGTGSITMNGGRLVVADYYDTDRMVTLSNTLILGATASFGTTYNNSVGQQLASLLTITGATSAASGSTINVSDHNLLNLTGNVSGTSLSFNGLGTAYLSGTGNSYTGGTSVSNGVVVLMGSVPASGTLTSSGSGYLGSGVTSTMSTFLSNFSTSATGILGFDSPTVSAPQTFTGNINLSTFNSSLRLGTATSAIFSGTITPQSSAYQFGGRGTLTVSSALTGSRSVTSSNGLQLYLTGANTYSNGTNATTGAVIFAGASSLPGSGSLVASSGGYIGNTQSAGVTEATFLGRFNAGSTDGVVGFDADVPATGRTVSGALDLTNFSSNAFVGTSTKVSLTGVITVGPSNEYRFTGFRDGQLTVASTLSSGHDLRIGLNPSDIASSPIPGTPFNPSVTITGSNTFTGHSTLQSGWLYLGNANALSTGTLYISTFGAETIGLGTTSNLSIANNISISNNAHFQLGGPSDFTLSGAISGAPDYVDDGIDKVTTNILTLSGNNSGLSSAINIRNGTIVFASDNAAGVGNLNIRYEDNPGAATFTSLAPVMGNLYGDSGTALNLNMGAGHNLTINQNTDNKFQGDITGTGGLTKSGTAQLELSSSNNTYSGNTQITGGTLLASNNNALGTGSVSLNGGTLNIASGTTLGNTIGFAGSGGIVSGNGALGSAITFGSKAILSPGNSVGSLTFNSGITWSTNGLYVVEVSAATGSAGSGYDTINATGGLTFNATLGSPFTVQLITLNGSGGRGFLTDFTSSSSYSWRIATTSGVTGFNAANFVIDTSLFANSIGTGSFSITNVGNNIYLNFNAVPEPSTWAMLASGAAAVAFFARRRRRA